jgi:molecular chaperone GrpE
MEKLKEEEKEKSFYTLEEVKKIESDATENYLRLAAEFENYKRRTKKEKDDLILNTKTKMLGAILDLDSDLSIAVKQEKDNQGLKLMQSKIETFLNNQGVKSIQTETYDSDLHEVISVLEVGEEKIIDVISKGYTLNEQPFRYPKIILGK